MDGSAARDTANAGLDEPTGGWPTISDYWPDAPHRMGPEADYFVGVDAPPPADPDDEPTTRLIMPPPVPRRRGLRVLLGVLAAVVFLGGSVLALGRMVLRNDDTGTSAGVTAAPTQAAPTAGGVTAAPSPPVSVQPSPTTTAAPSAEATTPAPTVPPFTSGTFELTGNVTVLGVTIADLGADPVRVSTPDGSGLEPKLSRDGSSVRLDPRPDGSKGSGRLDVRLNRRITWSLRMTGGMREATYALANGKIRRIDLIGGVATIDMALPAPDETLPIRMTGGVNTWTITTASRVPVTVLLRDGAGTVVLNGDRTRGVDRNTRLRADGDGDGELNIDAVAGVGTLTVAPAD